MNVAEVLEKRRAKRGISYTELARRCDINNEMVGRFCKGISKPSGEQLVKMAAELELELSDFISPSYH